MPHQRYRLTNFPRYSSDTTYDAASCLLSMRCVRPLCAVPPRASLRRCLAFGATLVLCSVHVTVLWGSNRYNGVELYFGKPYMLGCSQDEVIARQLAIPHDYILRGVGTHPDGSNFVYITTEYVVGPVARRSPCGAVYFVPLWTCRRTIEERLG